jgi:hypothetical protein
MACKGCTGKIRINEERAKHREMARKMAALENRSQVIIEHEGRLYIECESCWEKGGRIGKAIEYFIV